MSKLLELPQRNVASQPPAVGWTGRGGGRRRWPRLALVGGAVGAALVVGGAALAAVAEAGRGRGAGGRAAASAPPPAPIRGAIHNPPFSAYERTTGIFARTNLWTVRIQNLGGGALLAGCDTAVGHPACLEAANAAGGPAFVFSGAGGVGGEIHLANPDAAPLTTNAHGVASGFNANYLEGHTAAEFLPAGGTAANAANAERLGGQPASSYLQSGSLLFAQVGSGKSPALGANRGATAVTRSESQTAVSYTVTFGTADLSSCSFTASPIGVPLAGGALGVEPDRADKSAVILSAPKEFEAGFYLQVVC